MPPRISVIVPIYNAASTLRAAVQSILTQDIAGLEVLLVDDGSTDATPGLCHDLALRDDRIQVITQKNAGICAARNRGLSVAEGMYVTFCDDDDLLLPGALALLLQKAEDTGADIVRADYELIHISPDGTETPQPHPAGTACDLAADGDYRKFLQNSGPQCTDNIIHIAKITNIPANSTSDFFLLLYIVLFSKTHHNWHQIPCNLTHNGLIGYFLDWIC